MNDGRRTALVTGANKASGSPLHDTSPKRDSRPLVAARHQLTGSRVG